MGPAIWAAGLREAATAVICIHGPQTALREVLTSGLHTQGEDQHLFSAQRGLQVPHMRPPHPGSPGMVWLV